MGSEHGALDLWLWRAGRRQPAGDDGPLDGYPFDGPLYPKLTRGEGPSPSDFRTARAAGNPHAQAEPGPGASSLAARGFGSATFRPQPSQRVTARSDWRDGRWTVVLWRPLHAGPDDGIPLEAGGQYSVAFALWDGASRDRNGQKLVSIWHDLKLEP
jgi:hypothetical protein